MDFMKAIEDSETVYTENGAKGYKTCGHSIVDLNFKIPAYGICIDRDLFDKSLAEDKNLTLRWLLYLRDIREGAGERKSFRDFLLYLCQKYEDLAISFISKVPIAEYGRWDDVVWLYCQDSISYREKCLLANVIRKQVEQDKNDYLNERSISLLVKWLPSENASSKITKENAKKIRTMLKLSSKEYRKLLSTLREYINIVERKMSSNQWSSIDYSSVPSRANLLYSAAFLKHDYDRRCEYLNNVVYGNKKINADALFLHDIVHRYGISGDWHFYLDEDKQPCINISLEQLWAAQKKVKGFSNTLVVRDGSGSMMGYIGKGTVTALEVADAITLYCCENNEGLYKNKFVTFSSRAKVVDVGRDKTLYDKLKRLAKEDDCSNTNIEDVFNLVLRVAIKNNVKQEDLPLIILIISDMEYDGLSCDNDSVLFEALSQRYKEKGYKLPKLVFWNVNSKTNVIPIQQNENGVILLSGFSKNLMELVMSSELDPFKALVDILNKSRYDVIDSVIN